MNGYITAALSSQGSIPAPTLELHVSTTLDLTVTDAPLVVPRDTGHPHVLTAECSVCDLSVEQVPGSDALQLLRTFREHHPMTASMPHTHLVPEGWRVPWSVPGSWSN